MTQWLDLAPDASILIYILFTCNENIYYDIDFNLVLEAINFEAKNFQLWQIIASRFFRA